VRRPRAARPNVDRSAFAGFRFPSEVITVAVRWYLRYGFSYRDVEELLAEPLPPRGADGGLRRVRGRSVAVRPSGGRRTLAAARPPRRGQRAAAGFPPPHGPTAGSRAAAAPGHRGPGRRETPTWPPPRCGDRCQRRRRRPRGSCPEAGIRPSRPHFFRRRTAGRPIGPGSGGPRPDSRGRAWCRPVP